MTDNAIEINHLKKIYHLYDKPTDLVKEFIHPLRKQYHHDFTAIDDLCLTIKKGQTVGIIGKNGAGKSTLLKMITGVSTPTGGAITVNGIIASLLELGAGFNPMMTGMENIYLNGTIMGFSKREMTGKVDAIKDFADIGEFIYQPVKMYSSGMFARLAFSVAINVDPDILIVDEALSVGDMAFQMKCFQKFRDFQESGKTILFVTHGLDTVIRYCTRGIVIDTGKIVCDGSPKVAVDAFKKVLSGDFYNKNKGEKVITGSTQLLKKSFDEHSELNIYGNSKATIYDYGILDENGKPSAIIEYNTEFIIVMKVKFFETILAPIFAFTLKDIKGLEITGTNSSMKYVTTSTYEREQMVTVTFSQKANLQPGQYALSLGCVNMNDNGVEVYSRIYDAILFDVIGSTEMVGFFDLGSKISVS